MNKRFATIVSTFQLDDGRFVVFLSLNNRLEMHLMMLKPSGHPFSGQDVNTSSFGWTSIKLFQLEDFAYVVIKRFTVDLFSQDASSRSYVLIIQEENGADTSIQIKVCVLDLCHLRS